MRTVGVLGGMGPQATVLFMQRCIDSVAARDDRDHVPLLVDQNSQMPSRIAAILGGGHENPGSVLAGMARKLEASGAEALVMPCNTAHHYSAQIRSAVAIPFISMVDLATAHGAALAPGQSLGVLGSPALAKVGVFEPSLKAQTLGFVHLQNPDAMLRLIQSIKTSGVPNSAVMALSTEATAMAASGAAAICVACTEFSLVADEISAPVPVFDALDLLVDASVRFAQHGILPAACLAGETANNQIKETMNSC